MYRKSDLLKKIQGQQEGAADFTPSPLESAIVFDCRLYFQLQFCLCLSALFSVQLQFFTKCAFRNRFVSS